MDTPHWNRVFGQLALIPQTLTLRQRDDVLLKDNWKVVERLIRRKSAAADWLFYRNCSWTPVRDLEGTMMWWETVLAAALQPLYTVSPMMEENSLPKLQYHSGQILWYKWKSCRSLQMFLKYQTLRYLLCKVSHFRGFEWQCFQSPEMWFPFFFYPYAYKIIICNKLVSL